MRKISAVLIDPFAETITDIELEYVTNKDKLSEMYRVIDCGLVDKRSFDDDSHDIVVDDEGMHRLPEGQIVRKFFSCNLATNSLFFGRGVVVGVKHSSRGAVWSHAKLKAADLKDKVKFFDKNSALHYASEMEEL